MGRELRIERGIAGGGENDQRYCFLYLNVGKASMLNQQRPAQDTIGAERCR
jgi:hypothetical protein